jgi:hypothetical protein
MLEGRKAYLAGRENACWLSGWLAFFGVAVIYPNGFVILRYHRLSLLYSQKHSRRKHDCILIDDSNLQVGKAPSKHALITRQSRLRCRSIRENGLPKVPFTSIRRSTTISKYKQKKTTKSLETKSLYIAMST